MLAKGIAIPQPQQHFQHAVPTNTTTHTSSHIPSSQPAQGTTYTVSSRSTIPSTSQPSTSGPSASPYNIQSPIHHALDNITGTSSAYLPAPNSYSSISRPLDLHVDAKMKAKIMSHEFIEFGSLLSTSSHPDQFRIQVNGDNLSLVPNSKPFQIKSIEQWLQAFHVFVSVFVQAHPSKTISLMKYADTIQTLARRSGFAAAMFYDSNFRKWLQVNPIMPWDELNNELYMHALGIGLRANNKNTQQPFPASKPNRFPKGKCWDFLKTGVCTRGADCKFIHSCSKCGGQHSSLKCKETDSSVGGSKPSPSQAINKPRN